MSCWIQDRRWKVGNAPQWRPGRIASRWRGRGAAAPRPLDDAVEAPPDGPGKLRPLLAEVVRLAAGAPAAQDVSAVLTGAATSYGLTRCDLLTWDAVVRADPGRQQRWSSAGAPSAGGPGAEDVLVVDDDDATLGFLRTEPALPGAAQGDFAVLAAALSLVLGQAIEVREVAALRQDTLAAHAELTDQRQRTAAAMDRTRRQLEQDLHDGAQGDLVALGMRLSMRRSLGDVPLPGGARVPEPAQLLAEAHALRVRITATASGLLPTRLADGGLPAALRHELPSEGVGSLDIVLAPELERRRYPTPIEAAVYFLCAEAVVNARKHAPGADIRVEVRSTFRGVDLVVTDTGPGFDGPHPPGAFRALRERVSAVAGVLEVVSSVADGTVVRASIPC